MARMAFAVLLAMSTLLAGCFGDGQSVVKTAEVEPTWSVYERVDAQDHEDERLFVTVDLATNQTTNTTYLHVTRFRRLKLSRTYKI